MVSFLEAIQNEFWPYRKFSLTTFLNTFLTYKLISISQKRNKERTLKIKILPPPQHCWPLLVCFLQVLGIRYEWLCFDCPGAVWWTTIDPRVSPYPLPLIFCILQSCHNCQAVGLISYFVVWYVWKKADRKGCASHISGKDIYLEANFLMWTVPFWSLYSIYLNN